MAGTVIIGVDGSETARAAADKAARITEALDATLHVVCAFAKFEVERMKVGSEEFVFSTESSAMDVAVREVHQLSGVHPGLRCEPHVQEGKPAEALVDYAAKAEAELIVVGNKRVQGIARVLGSIATDVAQKAPCDVYIAHTHVRR